jgi:hypothetical protein
MPAKEITIPLGNKSYASPYYSIDREICQNMYHEFAQSTDAKAEYYLVKIPGLKRFGNIPVNYAGACRAMMTAGNGRTFGVFGNNMLEILSNGAKSFIGTIDTYTGVVQIAENGYQLILVDGTNGWILNFGDNNWTKITDEYFPGNSQATLAPTHVCYIDTYFIVNVPNTNEYYYSESYYQRAHDNTTTDYDPLEPNGYWNPINSGKKIGKSDNIIALANCNNYLWLFGANSNEVHYDTGDFNGQLFARYEGAILNYGCNSKNSIATYANNVFWLSSDISGTLGVFTNDGLVPKRISTRGIEQIIENFSTYTDCIGYTYAQSGHAFYVMQFPTANRTFVYDLVTDRWHERTYLSKGSGALYAWKGMFATTNFSKLIMGDNATSAIYQLDPEYYQNDNAMDLDFNYIRCAKNTPIAFDLGKMIRYNWAQIVCNQGQGLRINTVAGVGADPHVQLHYSNDMGITYLNERSAPLGKIGQTLMRSRVVGLGSGRNRVFMVTMTDPVPFILVSIIVSAESMKY